MTYPPQPPPPPSSDPYQPQQPYQPQPQPQPGSPAAGYPPPPGGAPPPGGGYPPQPPPGAYAGQPGYGPPPPGQPGYGAPPGMGQPPPRKSNTGWIVGAVAGGVALLLIMVVGAVVVIQLAGSDEDDQPPVAQQPAPTAPPDSDATDEEEPPEVETPPAEQGGGDGSYGFVEDLCEVADLSPVFDIVPDEPDSWSTSGFDNGDAFSTMSCTIDLDDGTSSGFLSIFVSTDRDTDGARQSYESQLGGFAGMEPHESEVASGPWDEATVEQGGDWTDAEATIFAYQDRLSLSVSVSLNGPAATDGDLADAVVEVAESIIDVTLG